MTREPDRFDKQAKELVHRVDGMTYGHNDDERAEVVAAALRAAESSALERAAQVARPYSYSAEREIRALIPPAAAPAAEDDTPRCNTFGAMGLPSIAPAAETGTCKNFWHPGHGDEIHANDSGCLNWKPAAETGKAQGAEAPPTSALADVIAEAMGKWPDAYDALDFTFNELSRLARAAPPEREGT